MAKMGRPKVEVIKDKTITMRVTPAEYEIIKEYAQSHNLTWRSPSLSSIHSAIIRVQSSFRLWKGA